jgi:hypothetical protein
MVMSSCVERAEKEGRETASRARTIGRRAARLGMDESLDAGFG